MKSIKTMLIILAVLTTFLVMALTGCKKDNPDKEDEKDKQDEQISLSSYFSFEQETWIIRQYNEDSEGDYRMYYDTLRKVGEQTIPLNGEDVNFKKLHLNRRKYTYFNNKGSQTYSEDDVYYYFARDTLFRALSDSTAPSGWTISAAITEWPPESQWIIRTDTTKVGNKYFETYENTRRAGDPIDGSSIAPYYKGISLFIMGKYSTVPFYEDEISEVEYIGDGISIQLGT